MGNAPRWHWRTVILVAALAFARCGGQEQDAFRTDSGIIEGGADSAADAGVSEFSCSDPAFPGFDAPVAPPIDGRLVVFVRNGEAETRPLAGATVQVIRGARMWTARTDLTGCVQFDDEMLDGPVDVHSFARGRVFSSAIGHAHRVLLTSLRIARVSDPPAPKGTVTGEVLGLETVTTTSATMARLARVDQVWISGFTPPPQQLLRDDGSGVAHNVTVVGAGRDLRNFTVVVDPRFQRELSVFAGRMVLPEITPPELEFTHVGLLSNLVYRSGGNIVADIQITQPLTETTHVSFSGGPPLHYAKLFSFIRVPSGGLIFLGGAYGMSAEFSAPMLIGDFGGSTYGGAAQLSDGEFGFSTVISEGSAAPVLDVGELADLPTVRAGGRILSLTVDPTTTESVYVAIRDESEVFWTLSINEASEEVTVGLPEVPVGLRDPLAVATHVRVIARALRSGSTPADRAGPAGMGPLIRRSATDLIQVRF